MLNLKKVLILSLLLFLTILIGLAVYLYVLLPAKNTAVSKNTVTNDSTFKKVLTTTSIKDPTVTEAIYNQYQNSPEKLLGFKYGWDVLKLDSAAPWDIAKTPFKGEVKSVDLDAKTIKVKITSPNTMPYYDQVLEITPTCSKDNTYMYVSKYNKNFYGEFDFFKEVTPGAEFMSFCLDNSCTQTGNLCKLFVKEWQYADPQ